MKTLHLTIEGLSDIGGSSHLEKALEAVPGVQSVEINSADRVAVVEYEEIADEREVIEAAKAAGFSARLN